MINLFPSKTGGMETFKLSDVMDNGSSRIGRVRDVSSSFLVTKQGSLAPFLILH